MAYLDETLLVDFQQEGGFSDFQENQHGIIDAVVERSNPTLGQPGSFISPDSIAQLQRISGARGHQIPVIKDEEVVVVTTPGFSQIPSNLPNSDKYSFTAFDVFSGMRFYPASYENNTVGADFEKNNRMRRILRSMATKVEEILVAQMELRKTQILNFTAQASQGAGTFSFDAPTDTLSISKDAQREVMWANLNALMRANKLPGMYSFVGSPLATLSQDNSQQQSGPNNNVNYQYQNNLFPRERIYDSHFLTPGADNFSGFFMRDGSLGTIENWPYDFRNNTVLSGGDRRWSIAPAELQYVRMRPAVYFNNEATDASALIQAGSGTDTNLIMTTFEEMALWLRFYVVYPYQTDFATRANDIVKLRGLTT
jgi:hypothetical protein